jgi:hypothetical protein
LEAKSFVLEKIGEADVGLILGTGLSKISEAFSDVKVFDENTHLLICVRKLILEKFLTCLKAQF